MGCVNSKKQNHSQERYVSTQQCLAVTNQIGMRIEEFKMLYQDYENIFNKEIDMVNTLSTKIESPQITLMRQMIKDQLNIPESYFDSRYDKSWKYLKTTESSRGQINNNNQIYNKPKGYVGLGLKVDESKSIHIQSNTNQSTWIVLFHKTSPDCIVNILKNNLQPGPRQQFASNNCRFGRGAIGNGVYFSDQIQVCESYGQQLQLNDKKVNSMTVKSPSDNPHIYIQNNSTDIIPYRLLITEYQ